eukprot:gene10362-9159_t
MGECPKQDNQIVNRLYTMPIEKQKNQQARLEQKHHSPQREKVKLGRDQVEEVVQRMYTQAVDHKRRLNESCEKKLYGDGQKPKVLEADRGGGRAELSPPLSDGAVYTACGYSTATPGSHRGRRCSVGPSRPTHHRDPPTMLRRRERPWAQFKESIDNRRGRPRTAAGRHRRRAAPALRASSAL